MGWEPKININLTAPSKPRNLIVLLDGTWSDETGRDGNGLVTNIYKLFTCLEGQKSEQHIPLIRRKPTQLAMYFRGVGNDDDNSLKKTYFQGTFGAGEKNIRDNAYANIVKTYRPGDRIFILGFSRGAACARLLASKLERDGIPEWIELKYGTQTNHNTGEPEKRFLQYNHGKKQATVQVEFLGIFDTVGAFGIPINIGLNFQKINLFKDLTVSKCVKQTVHLVSIDESREPFIPTLVNHNDSVEEVWFAGVHADIGGTYHHCELGGITLGFMVDRLRKATGPELPLLIDQDKLDVYTGVDLTGGAVHMHYHGDGIKKEPRPIHVLKKEKPARGLKPKIHSSVLKLMDHSNFRLVEEQNSFKKLIPIEYRPAELKAIHDQFDVVD